MDRPSVSLRRAVIAGAFVLVAAAVGCSGDKAVPSSQGSNDALRKEAEIQKKMHDREMHNR
ncbi:MAG TPA: hypothetical protein VH120_00280 [Gemmataceae bacterium]|nr:hypothetical protein [Gemmataceae bacterium]